MPSRHATIVCSFVLLSVLAVNAHARGLLQASSTVFIGNIAVRLVHQGATHRYALDFYGGNSTNKRLGIDVPDIPASGPPALFYTGTTRIWLAIV